MESDDRIERLIMAGNDSKEITREKNEHKWTDLRSLAHEELCDAVLALGERRFRGDQVYDWIHRKLVREPEEMRNVPAAFRERLLADHPFYGVRELEHYVSKIDGTRKYLFELHDGNVIESVLMRYRHGNSVCISSQAGCRMGCSFCASTLMGLSRNLYPSEMLDQIYMIQKSIGERVSHIVVMGTGEPLDNFEGLHRFLTLISDAGGLNISPRNITVSTCGLVPEIYRFADLHPQVTLAISLHAPEDELRRTMMPIANRYSLNELMEAAGYYVSKTGRRISFEYSLVRGVNDQMSHAGMLADLVRGLNCHINLIPVNPIKERDYVSSDKDRVGRFKKYLESEHIQVTVRREMGRDIQAACGQLRKSYKERSGNP